MNNAVDLSGMFANWHDYLDLSVQPPTEDQTFSNDPTSAFQPFGNVPQMNVTSAYPAIPGVDTIGVMPAPQNTDTGVDPQVFGLANFPVPGYEAPSSANLAPAGEPPFVFGQVAPMKSQDMSTPDSAASTNTSSDSGHDLTNAQQKASALRYFKSARPGGSRSSTSPGHGVTSDREKKPRNVGVPISINHVAPGSEAVHESEIISPGKLYGRPSQAILTTTSKDTVDGITERLGEFLFDPVESERAVHGTPSSATSEAPPKKASRTAKQTQRDKALTVVESDGLDANSRNMLLDCFLTYSRLFFEMSIPRFRYRMTFQDRRRPAPALLFAMYLWATRISHQTQAPSMEQHFFTSACKALDVSSASRDRLMDCLRAVMLLSSYTYTAGRYHEVSGLSSHLLPPTCGNY